MLPFPFEQKCPDAKVLEAKGYSRLTGGVAGIGEAARFPSEVMDLFLG